MPNGAPLLELRGVSKRFGAVQALTDVDFVAEAGQVTALVGDNGAGKSTLIKTISGIQPCDSLDVVANLYLGREELSGPRVLNETGMEQQASRVLKRLAVRIPSVRTQV